LDFTRNSRGIVNQVLILLTLHFALKTWTIKKGNS